MMNETVKRVLGLAVSGLLTFTILVPAANASETDEAAIARWFVEQAPSQVIGVLSGDAEWLADLRGDGAGKLSFGDPVPMVGIRPPGFDLKRDALEGNATLEANLDRSFSEYCARVVADGAPAPLIACAKEMADGQITMTGTTEIAFLDGSSAALPEAGILQTQGGWLGVTGGKQQQVVALDASAKTWIGGESVDGGDFVMAVAKQKAEYDAVARIDGPVAGGAMPLFEVDEAWQKEVAHGLAVPDDQAWNPEGQSADGPAPASGVDPEPSTVWPLIAALIAIVVFAAVGAAVLIVRRRRSSQAEDVAARRSSFSK